MLQRGLELDNSGITLPRCHDLKTICDSRVKEWFEKNNIELGMTHYREWK